MNVNRDLGGIKAQIVVADQIIQHAIWFREIDLKAEQKRFERELMINRDIKLSKWKNNLKF